MNHLKLGSLGEDLGIKYLQKNNYQIINKNYRKKWGEIDIIAFDRKTKETVFVEVKTLKKLSTSSLLPEEELTKFKIQKLQKAILSFLSEYHLEDKPWRFDFIAIEILGFYSKPKIRHYQDVFLDFE